MKVILWFLVFIVGILLECLLSLLDMKTNKEYMYDKRSHSFKECKDYKEKMNIAIVYGVYKHNIQMFYDLNNNLVSPKEYFDTHIEVDHLYFLDIHTNILYRFNRNDGNEYKISYDFADKVFGSYFRDNVDEEKYDQLVSMATKGFGIHTTK